MAKLENYNGSVQLMAGITQKGGGDFALIDANAVQTREDGTRLDAVLEELYGLIDKVNALLGNGEISVQEQISQRIDPTLSIESAAADAKVTGDEINLLKSKIFVGTSDEYETALENGEIVINTIVVITDDENLEDSDGTTSVLGEAVLGYLVLGQ